MKHCCPNCGHTFEPPKKTRKPKSNFDVIAIGNRSVKFSDSPVKVDGVTYTPKWSWSEDYRRGFKSTHGKARTSNEHTRARAYNSWLESRDSA